MYLVIDFEKKVVSSVSRAPPIDDGVNYVFAGRQVCAPVKLEPENESRYQLIFKVKFNWAHGAFRSAIAVGKTTILKQS